MRLENIEKVEVEILATKERFESTPVLLTSLAGARSRGQFFGRVIFSMVYTYHGRGSAVTKANMRGKTRLDLSRLGIMLELYRLDTGKYPDSLNNLKPDDIPIDRFTDKPLIYRTTAEGYVLYSPGPNAKDDGGIDYRDALSDRYDVTLQVSRPKAEPN